jgi:hypothetical protein
MRAYLKVLSKAVRFTAIGFGAFCCLLSQSAEAAGSPESLTPDQIKQLLTQEEDEGEGESKLAKLATDLELMIPKRTRWGATEDMPCTAFPAVEVIPVKLHGNKSQVLLNISSDCRYTYLVLLEESKANLWRRVQTVSVAAINRTPVVTFESMVSRDAKEIIVKDYETESGSGVSQANMAILKLLDGKLRVVFDEPTHVVYAVPLKGEGNTEQSEDSEFSIVKHSGQTSLKDIIQKQVIQDHQTKITRYWEYEWVPELQKFQKYRIFDGRR